MHVHGTHNPHIQVRGPLIAFVARYLRRAVAPLMEAPQDEEQRQQQPRTAADAQQQVQRQQAEQQEQQQQQQHVAEAVASTTSHTSGAAGASDASGAAAGDDLAAVSRRLRHDRVLYCLEIISRSGEFVEVCGA